MRLALLLAVGAPAAAAVSLVGADARSRRLAGTAGALTGAAGAVALLVLSNARAEPVVAGFSVDRWRAALMLAVMVSAAASVATAARGEGPPALDAAALATAGAAAASIAAGSTVAAGLLLVASSLGFAVAASASGGLRERRAAAALLGSDVLAVAGMVIAARGGLTPPPEPGLAASILLLAAAGARLGLVPVAGPVDDAVRGSPALGSLALGAVRAQGLLLALWGLGGPRRAALGFAAAGAATVAWGAYRAAREHSLAGLASAHAGLIAVGLGIGGRAGLWGALLLAGAGFLLWPLAIAAGSSVARMGTTLWAGGAALAGAVLVAGTALSVGVSRPAYLGIALPAAAGAVALAAARPAASGGARSGWWWAAPASAAALALAFVPGSALSRFAEPAAASLGPPELLRDAGALALGDRAGLWAAVLFAAALLAGGSLEPASPPSPRRPHRWSAWWGSAPPVPSARSDAGRARAFWERRRWGAFVSASAAAAAAAAVLLYATGVRRGFL